MSKSPQRKPQRKFRPMAPKHLRENPYWIAPVDRAVRNDRRQSAFDFDPSDLAEKRANTPQPQGDK